MIEKITFEAGLFLPRFVRFGGFKLGAFARND